LYGQNQECISESNPSFPLPPGGEYQPMTYGGKI
jgi:hypothetical protein